MAATDDKRDIVIKDQNREITEIMFSQVYREKSDTGRASACIFSHLFNSVEATPLYGAG